MLQSHFTVFTNHLIVSITIWEVWNYLNYIDNYVEKLIMISIVYKNVFKFFNYTQKCLGSFKRLKWDMFQNDFTVFTTLITIYEVWNYLYCFHNSKENLQLFQFSIKMLQLFLIIYRNCLNWICYKIILLSSQSSHCINNYLEGLKLSKLYS